MLTLPSRQVHLDFHTSEHIPEIGRAFDPQRFVAALQKARVNGITLFAKCHHGWSYYDTTVGARHPQLEFDLLKAQYEACLGVGIAVQIYITAGWDERNAFLNPQWRQITPQGTFRGSRGLNLIEPCWKDMCFNSPYLDVLCDQIKEVAGKFPKAAGLFLDIVRTEECCCSHCLTSMAQAGLDWTQPEHRRQQAIATRDRYYRATSLAAQQGGAGKRLFHNTSHLAPGDRSVLSYFTHYELESLPTGGWGYDHLPMSAAYARTLKQPYLGMTGKFHTFWGEYGGYKHPNALRYECALMLALGAACSIGDQLEPNGEMDESTYGLIGQAYGEVEAKEPWCDNTEAVSDVAIYSPSGHLRPGATDWESRRHPIDAGCARLLCESHLLFDVVDQDSDFSPYKLLILPDVIRMNQSLADKVKAYVQAGGKLLMTGESGLAEGEERFAIDVGARYMGRSPFDPDYILPNADLRPDYLKTPMVMYAASHRIQVTSGKSLGQIFDPYFNRTAQHFCNHIHTPRRPEASGFDCGVALENMIYLAHPVFSIYREKGAAALKQIVQNCINRLLGSQKSVECNLPSWGRVTLRYQAAQHRHIVHLLSATPIHRGTVMDKPIDVIDDITPLHDVEVTVRVATPCTRATLQPQGTSLTILQSGQEIRFTLPKLDMHQMVVLDSPTL